MSRARSSVESVPAVLHNIDWGTYTRLLRAFHSRRGFRLTYDRGTLEIMSPHWERERAAYLLGRFIDVITEELRLPYEPGRCVTLRRRRKSRGLEPDNCYWIANAARLAGKAQLDLSVDPPPDLAIEIDVTRTSLDRMSIYAALGVPEVWRVASDGFTFNVLESGAYQVRSHSLSFPQLASADFVHFLDSLRRTDTTTQVAEFRDWVRQVLPVPPDREKSPARTTSGPAKYGARVIMGIAWYRPEQWGRLLEVSVDRDELEATHAEWKKHAEKHMKRLRRDGLVVRRVDVDIEELLQYCKKKAMAVNAKARADFAAEQIQRGGGKP